VDSRTSLAPDTILDGSYRIVRTIGAGGFGITYAAEDVHLATQVAIKEYYPVEFGDRDKTMSVRPKSERHKPTFDWGRMSFLTEARTVARFRHPSIVRVTRVFEANSTAYMVMDFEKGQTFEDWLGGLGRPPTQPELDGITMALLDALEMMHGADFLHRDLAPDNIIVRGDGTPVLLDFGSARRAVGEMSRTLTGIVKAGYSPPEQYASDARLQGPWSDLYAFGGMLYRAVTGKAPDESTLRSIDDRLTPATRSARGSYRPGFLAAIDACLRIKGADRPQSVAQLRPLLQAEAVQPAPTRPLQGRAQAGSIIERLTPPTNISLRQWSIVALAVAALLLGGAAGLFLWPRPEPEVADAIGTATIESNGTIVVDVRRPGLAILRYAPSDPHYAEVAKHIGPLRPGETKLVRPWPELTPAEKRSADERAQRQIEANLKKAEEDRRKAAEERARQQAEAEKKAAEERAQRTAQATHNFEEGERYYHGRGVARDYVKAREYYEMAAAANHRDAAYSLGWLYEFGQGVPQDYVKAREWYEKSVALERGGGIALYRLGRIYDLGLGTSQDYAKARQWYEKAAAAGNPDGDYGQAWLYFEGKGVKADAAKAKELLEKSVAAGGGADTLYSLGYFHATGGPGLPQNLVTAREWYRKAVAKGSSWGMERLAILLDEGRGGPADYQGAAEWLLEAARKGKTSAIEHLRGDMSKWNARTRTELKRRLAAQNFYSGAINDKWDEEARAAAGKYLAARK
jgi:TPR repeat protein/serine/threonine protein kinase